MKGLSIVVVVLVIAWLALRVARTRREESQRAEADAQGARTARPAPGAEPREVEAGDERAAHEERLRPADEPDLAGDTLFADRDRREAEETGALPAAHEDPGAVTDPRSEDGPAAEETDPTPHRVSDDLGLVRDGGYGVGSAAPLDDGAQPLGHPVKGSRASMTYDEPGGPAYATFPVDVWFTDAEAAERSGFRRT